METKKSDFMKFVDEINFLQNELLDENSGCLVLGYELQGKESTNNYFSAYGKMTFIAECLLACMSKDQGLANVIIAAANAYVQNRMMNTQMRTEPPASSVEAVNPKIVS